MKRVVLVVLVLASACSSSKTTAPTRPPVASPATIANGRDRILWQAPIGARPIIVGTSVVAAGQSGGVEAFDIRTGLRRWHVTDGGDKLVHFVKAAGSTVVFVTGGPPAGLAGVSNANAVVAIDLQTGRRLWRYPLSNTVQLLGFAVTNMLAAVADADDTVVVMEARSGRRLWTVPPPPGCKPQIRGAGDVALAADSEIVVAARRCEPGGRALAEGFDPRTGRTIWTWDTPGDPLEQGQLSDAAIPPGTGVVLVPTKIAPLGVPSRSWNGPDAGFGEMSQFVAVDAATGRPLWRQPNSAADTFQSGGTGIVCLVANDAYECRGARSGLFAFNSRPSHHEITAYDDGRAGAIAAGFAYELDASLGAEQLVTRSVPDGHVVARTTLSIGEHSGAASNYGPGVVAAGDGVVLVRRADATGFPVIALTTK